MIFFSFVPKNILLYLFISLNSESRAFLRCPVVKSTILVRTICSDREVIMIDRIVRISEAKYESTSGMNPCSLVHLDTGEKVYVLESLSEIEKLINDARQN